MISIKPLISVFLITFALTNCGIERESSLSSTTGASPVFVLMGGNQTCNEAAGEQTPHGMDMLGELDALLSSTESIFGAPPRHIVSCYGESATVNYFIDSDRDTILRGDREQFRDAITANLADDSPLILIGHSYGGWLSMKTAQDIAANRLIHGLYTIDPISRENCSFEEPWGCNQAPSDISPSERNDIRDKTTNWDNFYQTKTWYLHSSKIDQAHDNHKISTSHTSIDTHSDVWNRINDGVRQL